MNQEEVEIEAIRKDVSQGDVWLIREPGVIIKPLTGYQISYNMERGFFMISWYGKIVASANDLNQAKQYAIYHLSKMLEMGYDA